LCFSNDSIEKQIYEISERIQKKSLYTVVRIDCLGEETLTLQKSHSSEDVNEIMHSEIPVISKIILKDKNDNHYTIRPTSLGLNFAEGKLTYNEYKMQEHREELKGYGIFAFILSFFLFTGWIFVTYFF